VRKDSLEVFRNIFSYLEEEELLNIEIRLHKIALFLVYQSKIQRSLDEMQHAWNHHRLRSEGNRSPVLLFELSCDKAIREGYWTGDPGDPIQVVDALYGTKDTDNFSSSDSGESEEEPDNNRPDNFIGEAHRLIGNIDCTGDDGNWGINWYQNVVLLLADAFPQDRLSALTPGFHRRWNFRT
jgi:hypothetical protein